MDQVLILTSDKEASFGNGIKISAIFVGHIAAYNTVGQIDKLISAAYYKKVVSLTHRMRWYRCFRIFQTMMLAKRKP